MQLKLLKEVFRKAREEGAPQTKHGLSHQISETLRENDSTQISYKTLEKYYDWTHGKGESKPIRKDQLDALSRYLGYKNFKDFKARRGRAAINWKRLLIFGILIGFATAIYFWMKPPPCMEWQEDRYVGCACQGGDEIPYDAVTLRGFRLIQADCSTRYFDEEGKPLIFYYKVGPQNLQCFTMDREHPLNGDPLKKITKYMIRQHICEDY